MAMAPRLRKLVLTAHVTSSVGWLGAVAAFLALAIVALVTADDLKLRAVHLAMDLIGRFVLVPLSLASLVSGIVQSLGSPWGLFRHYWVLFKLLMNVFATAVLLMYTETLGYVAGIAANETPSADDLGLLRSPSPVIHASLALLLLLLATTMAVYKPRGLTPYGLRKQHEQKAASTAD